MGGSASALLAVRELGVGFPAGAEPRPAVRDVSFTVSSGQVLALVGESGSGKSVTALSLLGLLPATARVHGSAVLAGPELAGTQLIGASAATLRSVRGRRIGAVFQDPFTAFDPVLRIGGQIAEALRAHDRSGGPPGPRVLALLERAGLRGPERIARSFPHELSGGQLQRAMIAMAISGEPDLLIADEPTTALDVTVQAEILDLLHELRRANGTAILLITHDMGVAADLADDIVVLRHGEVMEAGAARAVFAAPRSAYARELLDAVPRLDAPSPAGTSRDEGEGQPAAELRDVTITYGSGRHRLVAVDGVSLTVPAGETVGLVGESGSGKTTLGKAVARIVRPESGTITLAGRDLGALSGRALRAAQAEIGFVFQNPADSLNPRARVGAVVAEPLLVHTALSRAEREQRAARLLARVGLPADSAGRFPHELSGGQRQRVAIARALVLGPRLVIADEPTSSLDVLVQATILALLAELQREFGFGCLFISHDLAVVRQVSRQVAVMREGRLLESGPTEQVLARPQHEYTRLLLASVPAPDPSVRRSPR